MAKKPVAAAEPIDLGNLDECVNRIARIGIEIEGGFAPPGGQPWKQGPNGFPLYLGLEVIRDGSLDDFKAKLGAPYAVGEIVGPPIAPAAMTKWLTKYFPQHFDKTCGLHIHMSFNYLRHYMQLMVPEFQATVLHEMRKWAEEKGLDAKNPLWDRLDGKSVYCNHQFWADEQVGTTRKDYDKNRAGNRYTAIHYAFARHGTIECRLMPMMSLELSVSAMQRIMDVTNAFLVRTAKRVERMQIEVVPIDELERPYVEQRRILV